MEKDGDWQTISSRRLKLTALSPALLAALIDFDRAEISRHSALDFSAPWGDSVDVLKLRRDGILADPDYAPWSLRAISRREDDVVIGHIGFHTRPDPTYLKETVPGGVELGYTIFAPYRGSGYAQEACRSMMRWARGFSGVKQFVLSISPDNAPSLAIAEKLGFRQIGEQMDEIDGLEFVFTTTVD
ncbi:MAG TPA: GNAT family N-acetyltransferase [Terriglobales bacterium]|nr:GNAT family N-acetyltransferase [Terriglobales bacterium]